MNIKVIEDRVYFFASERGSIEIDDSLINEFCKNLKNLNLQDFINYCEREKIEQITDEDILKYCAVDGQLPELPEPIIGVGEFNEFVSGQTNITGDKKELDDLLDNLDIECVKESKIASDKLQELTEYILENYEDWKEEIGKVNELSSKYLFSPSFSNQKNTAFAFIRTQLFRFIQYFNILENLDEEISEPQQIDSSVDTDYAERLQNNLKDYISGLSVDEIEANREEIESRKQEINNLSVDDEIDLSTMNSDEVEQYTKNQFENSTFYINTENRISVCNDIINSILILKENEFIGRRDKVYLEKLEEKTENIRNVYEYQLFGFSEDLKIAAEKCPETTTEKQEYNQLLDEIDENSIFEITDQPITIEDRQYWVKFANLATKLSIISVPFWSTGINISGVPIPLPTIYINLGVINVKVPIPEIGINTSLPFLIVPFLAITGTVVSPYFLFVNIGENPIGPVGPNSMVCLFTWRSFLTEIKSNLESKELKPVTLKSGPIDIDLQANLTRILSIMVRDDLPPYKRLKLTNIPFVVFSLLNMIKIQRQTTGLP